MLNSAENAEAAVTAGRAVIAAREIAAIKPGLVIAPYA